MPISRAFAVVLFPFTLAAAVAYPRDALAVGESVDGFPSWPERVMLAWTNRARVDPQVEMSTCGNNCGEAACYKPEKPLYWDEKLNHAARFHAANMKEMGFFAHTSKCSLVPDLGSLYPGSCNGEATCSCVGGEAKCSPNCTDFSDRVALFGVGATGEIIASPSDPDQAFYLWLYESSQDTQCQFSLTNGHRWLLLTGGPSVGFGTEQGSVGDFGGQGGSHKIPSGSHYPKQGATVDAWASWSDASGPMSALINVDGSCSPMSQKRGTEANGAYQATVSGVGAGCHRYFFLFKDSGGQKVTYPETGSLGIGDASCADWDATRPAEGPGCDCAASCDGAVCGEDGCGGTCGMCEDGKTCQDGACVPDPNGSASGSGASGATGGGASGEDEEGCSCRAAGAEGALWSGRLFALLAATFIAAARRARRPRASS